jgi:hypothetical protein
MSGGTGNADMYMKKGPCRRPRVGTSGRFGPTTPRASASAGPGWPGPGTSCFMGRESLQRRDAPGGLLACSHHRHHADERGAGHQHLRGGQRRTVLPDRGAQPVSRSSKSRCPAAPATRTCTSARLAADDHEYDFRPYLIRQQRDRHRQQSGRGHVVHHDPRLPEPSPASRSWPLRRAPPPTTSSRCRTAWRSRASRAAPAARSSTRSRCPPAKPSSRSRSPAAPATRICTSAGVPSRPPANGTIVPYLIGNNETVTIDNPAGRDVLHHAPRVRGLRRRDPQGDVHSRSPKQVTELENGVPVPDLSGAAGSEKFYKIDRARRPGRS